MIRQGGWYWYLSGEEAKREKHKCGKWMYFFEDQSFACGTVRTYLQCKLCGKSGCKRAAYRGKACKRLP